MTSNDTIQAVKADASLGKTADDGSFNTDLIQIDLLMQIRDLLKAK